MPDDGDNSHKITGLIFTLALLAIVSFFQDRLFGGRFTDMYFLVLFVLVAFVNPIISYYLHKKVENVRDLFNVLMFAKVAVFFLVKDSPSVGVKWIVLVFLAFLEAAPWFMQYFKGNKLLQGPPNIKNIFLLAIIADGLLFMAAFWGFAHPYLVWVTYAVVGIFTLFYAKDFLVVVFITGAFYFQFPGIWLALMTVYVIWKANGLVILKGITLFGGILLLLAFVFQTQILTALSSGEVVVEGYRQMENIREYPKKIREAFDGFLDRTYKAARGDYYTGQVDENENKKLGVFIEKFTTEQRTFFLEGDEDIFAFGVITAESLEVEDCAEYDNRLSTGETLFSSREDCEKNQKVILACGLKDSTIKGIIVPEELDLYDIDGSSEGFDCQIPKESLKTKFASKPIEVKAIYPFTTKAYYRAFFMDDQRKKDLQRANIDPLTYYNFDISNIQRYTNGPIMVGFGVPSGLPIGVSEGKTTRLSFTLDKLWSEGEIEEITDVCVIPPDDLEITCNGFVGLTEAGKSNCPTAPGVQVLKESLRKQLKGQIGSSFTYNCRMKLTDSLLGQTPIKASLIKVTAKYKYQTTQDTFWQLRKGDGIKSDLNSCSEYCADEDGCFCPTDSRCKEVDEAVANEYNCDGKLKSSAQELVSGSDEAKKSACKHFSSCDDYDKASTASSFYETLKNSFGYVTGGESQRDLANLLCIKDDCNLNCEWSKGEGLFETDKCISRSEALPTNQGTGKESIEHSALEGSMKMTRKQIANFLDASWKGEQDKSNLVDAFAGAIAENIDPAFVIAIAAHESNFGVSVVDNNLFRDLDGTYNSELESIFAFIKLVGLYSNLGQKTPDQIACGLETFDRCYGQTGSWLNAVESLRRNVRSTPK